jgi:hypothetical protein
MPAFHSKSHTKPPTSVDGTTTISKRELAYLRSCQRVYWAAREVLLNENSHITNLSTRVRKLERMTAQTTIVAIQVGLATMRSKR